MRKMNIKVGDIRDCFVSLGKEYLDYSIYGDGSALEMESCLQKMNMTLSQVK